VTEDKPERDPLDSLKERAEACRQNGAFCGAPYRKSYSLNEAADAWNVMHEYLLSAIAAWTQERERTAAHEKEAMETMAGQQGLVDSLREKIAKLEAEIASLRARNPHNWFEEP
jgi:hypothetical protein